MCGIAGIYSYKERERTWPNKDLETMLKRIKHRGPDDQGVYIEPGLFLGHTRLAVIDLSSTGHQPMSTISNRYVISFNGEIYNYQIIRNELMDRGYRFISQSDTEVLLNAWQEWGVDCLDKVDGIFAFAIFDRTQKTLFLVRDHLGVKPLFYTIQKGQVFFASELPALFGPLNPCPEPDPDDIDAYFTYNYLQAPRTGLKGVRQLPPGSLLKVNPHGETLSRYWYPTYHAVIRTSSSELTDRFEEILSSVVKRQLVSDAPLGLFLSGGLDSYAVALSAVKAGHQPTAYTLDFTDANYSEAAAASEYAKYLGISSEIATFAWTENDIIETLSSMSELLADASCFPLYQISKYARKNVKVVLAGDGGDELLAGYDTYKAGMITPYIRVLPWPLKSILTRIAQALPPDKHRYGKKMVIERLLDAASEGAGRDHASFRRIFNPAMKKRVYTPDYYHRTKHQDPVGEYAGLLNEVPSERSYLTARQHADLIFHLPSILAKVDRMSMAHGLEVRVPLLSKDLVEFCLNLPDNAKVHRFRGKHILRNAINGRTPEKALNRPKAGFLPPVDLWFRGKGPMENVFGDLLNTAKSTFHCINREEVEKLWGEHKRSCIDAGFVLLGILQFMNWTKKINSSSE